MLSAVPLRGALFGDRNNTTAKTELIVLLTPRVIRNRDQADSATEALKKEVAPTKPPVPADAFRP